MLVINNIEVSSNKDGLYSLADLWSSTGNNNNKKPSKWLNLKGTFGKVEYLCTDRKSAQQNQQVISKDSNGYTYVCKELVYSYAMWISDKYHFSVIKAFDDLVNDRILEAIQIAKDSAIVQKVGDDCEKIIKDESVRGMTAMNRMSNNRAAYKRHASALGGGLGNCVGKNKLLDDADTAIANRTQYAMDI